MRGNEKRVSSLTNKCLLDVYTTFLPILCKSIIFSFYNIYCDVSPESRDIGGRISDCSLDNGLAKHNSPTTNNNSGAVA
jgi:hypothetical protein